MKRPSFIFMVICSYAQLIFTTLGSTWPSKTTGDQCPCESTRLCLPITHTTNRKEVFVFSVKNDERFWSKYDWSKVTTVVSFGYVNDSLTCLAHAHNARVVYLAKINVNFKDPSARKKWVEEQIILVEKHFLDGINFDFEGEVKKSETELRDGYTSLVRETNSALKRKFPHSQVSVDVGWTPNADVRFYDYVGLANSSDFLFVMAYAESSQICGECLALPNSGYHQTLTGLNRYQSPPYSIRPAKLVLGVPWYGLRYNCNKFRWDKCFIKHVPFRGVNCSDAASTGLNYGQLYNLIKTMPSQVRWNDTSLTPYISILSMSGVIQIQYDDPKSLSLKYELADRTNLKGVGMWTVDSLDYSDTAQGRHTRHSMFGALPSYK